MFWNVFGMTELGDLNTSEGFVITQYAGEMLLALYAIASLLVAINMLIAMMSNTYQRVAVSSKDFNRKISVSISGRSFFFQGRNFWQERRLRQRERYVQI